VLAIFLVPAFFVAVLRLAETRRRPAGESSALPAVPAAGE
jgi:hypothetical protein